MSVSKATGEMDMELELGGSSQGCIALGGLRLRSESFGNPGGEEVGVLRHV